MTTSSSTYVVATREPPTIVCPPWCVIPVEEHIADLPNWEGHVIHWSSDRVLVSGLVARIASSATPAGSPDPEQGLVVHLYDTKDPLSAAEALAAGEALIALAREALS